MSPFYQRMVYTNFSWNWHSGSNLFPRTIWFNRISCTQVCFCLVLLKSAQWFLKSRNLQHFFTLHARTKKIMRPRPDLWKFLNRIYIRLHSCELRCELWTFKMTLLHVFLWIRAHGCWIFFSLVLEISKQARMASAPLAWRFCTLRTRHSCSVHKLLHICRAPEKYYVLRKTFIK